jgi:hypothetical protein
MISKILRAKNWQIFLLILGSFFCIQFTLVMSIIETNSAVLVRPTSFDLYFIYVSLLSLLVLLTTGVWFLSIALGLQKIIPYQLQLDVSPFKVSLAIPALYSLFFIGFFIKITSLMRTASEVPSTSLVLDWLPYLLPCHLVAIYCIFYVINFTAKTIKTAELRRKVQFSDYVGSFFSICFLPIGIWFLQSKINRLVAIHSTNPEKKESSFSLLDDELF